MNGVKSAFVNKLVAIKPNPIPIPHDSAAVNHKL